MKKKLIDLIRYRKGIPENKDCYEDFDNNRDEVIKLLKYNKDHFSFEEIMEALDDCGFAPNLINDDCGKWAITSDGISPVCVEDEDWVDNCSFIISSKECWKDTIREALYYYLDHIGD